MVQPQTCVAENKKLFFSKKNERLKRGIILTIVKVDNAVALLGITLFIVLKLNFKILGIC